MTPEALLFLAWGASCAVIGAAGTAVFFLWREEKAARARQSAADVEFAPTLARVRPAIDMANHLHPAVTVVRRHRARLRAGVGLLAARVTAAVRAHIAHRAAVARRNREEALAALRKLVAASRPAPLAPPAPTEPAAAPAGHFAALDTNSSGWPVNPPVTPAAQVARVELPADFEGWVRTRNAELHARLTDPDSTGYIPRITAEVAQ